MTLNELFEATSKHVTFCFGRMNPPTIGHEQVLSTVAGVGGDHKIFLSQTQDKKKNPLDYPTKIKFLKLMFPKFAGAVVEDSNLNTIGKVCSYLYDQGYKHVTLVAGSDRLEDMLKLVRDYNGIEGKAHGFYKFETIDGKSSGERDPDGEGVSGVSASNARAAAANGNLEEFADATGAGAHAKALFNAVRKGMGIKGDVEEDISRRGFLRGLGAAAAGAAGIGALGKAQAQPSSEPGKPITIAYVMIDGEVRQYNLGDKFSNAREAEEFISKVLDKQGLTGYTLQIKHGYPKKKEVKEAPIELDRDDPMNPMIHSHDKANPAKLKYRMMRAAGQIKDLASRVDKASPIEWQSMTRQFDELKMNMEQIKHALEELAKIRKKGGIRSRGIDPMLDDISRDINYLKKIIIEHKKGRKAVKHSIKPRNPVAHAAQTVAKGSGPHKDKKKAAKQGDVKHKSREIELS